MASPFHFGAESCYIFDFFLLAISLTTIFQYGRSSIFGKCNHYFLGTGQASCPTTWWCCPWTPQRPLPPSSWSRSSTSTAGTTPTKLLPPSPYYWNWLAFYRFLCGYFLAISGLFGLHHNGLFTFGLSDWTTRTIGLSQFVLKRLLDYSNWTYGSSGLSKFGLHSK